MFWVIYTSGHIIFNHFEILNVILIQIILHLPPPELKVVLFVEFAIRTLVSIHEVINIHSRRTPLYF